MSADGGQPFARPAPVERIFNRLFGALVGIGLALPHNYLVEVRGRKSGKLYATPIDLLELDGRRYLVCPRGRSQWVRNAQASGRVTLKRGSSRHEFTLRELADNEKPPILKAYLDRFKLTVQRYFAAPAGSPPESFAASARDYPVFELLARPAASTQNS